MSTNTTYGFTETELDIAKHTDLPDLLSSLGYTLKRVGSYYTTAEMDSIRIKERLTWMRYSTRQGSDAISFLQEFCGCVSRRRWITFWLIMGGPETPPTGTSLSPAPSRLRPKKSCPSSCRPQIRTSGGCLRIFASGELRLR
ncbi:hypothetical protein AALC17_11290 [Oscillospiraceae bacterium 38-13]